MMIVLAPAGFIVVLASGAVVLLLVQARRTFRSIESVNARKYKGIAFRDIEWGDGDQEIDVLVVGDSLGAGCGASRKETTPAARTASMMAERCPGTRVKVVNLARPKSGARHLAAQLAKLPEDMVLDVAVIVIGANDALFPHHALRSVAYLRDCISHLRDRGTRVVCCTCPDMGGATALPVPLKQYAAVASRMLARRQISAVLKAGAVPVALHRVAKEDGQLSDDSFHPNDDGYLKAAKLVVDKIMPLIDARMATLPEPAAEIYTGGQPSWNKLSSTLPANSKTAAKNSTRPGPKTAR